MCTALHTGDNLRTAAARHTTPTTGPESTSGGEQTTAPTSAARPAAPNRRCSRPHGEGDRSGVVPNVPAQGSTRGTLRRMRRRHRRRSGGHRAGGHAQERGRPGVRGSGAGLGRARGAPLDRPPLGACPGDLRAPCAGPSRGARSGLDARPRLAPRCFGGRADSRSASAGSVGYGTCDPSAVVIRRLDDPSPVDLRPAGPARRPHWTSP